MDEKKFDAQAFLSQESRPANRTIIGYENFADALDQETYLENFKNAQFEGLLLAAGIYARYAAPVTLPFDMSHELPETKTRADDYLVYAYSILQPYCEFVAEHVTAMAEGIADEEEDEKYSVNEVIFDRFLSEQTAPLAVANRLLSVPTTNTKPYLHTNIMNAIKDDWIAYVEALSVETDF